MKRRAICLFVYVQSLTVITIAKVVPKGEQNEIGAHSAGDLLDELSEAASSAVDRIGDVKAGQIHSILNRVAETPGEEKAIGFVGLSIGR
jgi:hypothetical protein